MNQGDAMKKILYCFLFLVLFITILFFTFFPKKEVLVIPTLSNGKTYYEEKIYTQNDSYKLNATFPHTEYPNLNQQIKNKVQEEIDFFKQEIKDAKIVNQQLYTFDLWYEPYSYQNYLSFHFYVSIYTGGAHPNTYSFSINYDTAMKNLVTIQTLKKEDKNILNKLSTYTYQTLLKNEKIGNSLFEKNLLKTGTAPKEENFKTFVFTPEGLMVFFDRYQVAPYAYGEFYVVVPYNFLNLNGLF